MKTLNTRLIALLLALAPLSIAAQELKKEFNRTFATTSESKLMIANSFGEIQMEQWEGNEIKIDAVIRIEGNSEKAVKEAMEKMDIEFTQEGNRVMVRTQNKCNCGNKIKEFSIDYKVKVPSGIAVSLRNSFGDVFVQGHDGPVELEVEHGDFKIRNLSHEANFVKLSFGDGQARDINRMDVRIQHSDFNAENVEQLRAYIQFSDVELENITELYKELRIQHSDVNIDVSGSQWNKMIMDFDFSDVDLQVSSTAKMRMEVESSFGDVSAPSAMNVQKKENGFNTDYYRVSMNGDDAPISQVSLSHSDLSLSIR